MKKISVIIIVLFCAFGCKKKNDTISQEHNASTPIVTISGSQYYSIPVGGTLPTISATSYDTFYNASYPVSLDQSTLDNKTPGLYVVLAKAKNLYGYIGTANVYVAVTNIDPVINLAGPYKRTNGVIVHVTKVANGMYLTDNVGGVDPVTLPSYVVPGVFVQTDDTTLTFGGSAGQESLGLSLIVDNPKVSMVTGDTTIKYAISSPSSLFGPSVRTFVKQ